MAERNAVRKMKEEQDQREEVEQRLAESEDLVQGYHLPARTPFPNTRNSVILLGLGGVGKTTFINTLLHSSSARPDIATDSFKIYRYAVQSQNDSSRSTCSIYISDYMGQDLGSLVRAFVEQQGLPFSPMRYGHINTLILIVDLIPPPATGADDHKMSDQPDLERVQEHLNEWSDQTLDAVFGLLTRRSLTFICLFVNKADLVSNNNAKLRQSCSALFKPLVQRLEARGRGRLVKTIVGSVETGEGLPAVMEHLVRESVSDTEESTRN